MPDQSSKGNADIPMTVPGAGTVPEPKTCGLVMPISALDGVSADHWVEVRSIITEAINGITDPKFAVKLVSEGDDIGIIHKRIVEGVYQSNIIVCDVSGKNPNVMFELGMRLAFDKAVVIVKDDKTEYSFDTSPIEHLTYPRDLRYKAIVAFQQLLATKVAVTEKRSRDQDYSSFLKAFGTFQIAKIDEDIVPAEKLMLGKIDELASLVSRMSRRVDLLGPGASSTPMRPLTPKLAYELVRTAIQDYLDASSWRGVDARSNGEIFVPDSVFKELHSHLNFLGLPFTREDAAGIINEIQRFRSARTSERGPTD